MFGWTVKIVELLLVVVVVVWGLLISHVHLEPLQHSMHAAVHVYVSPEGIMQSAKLARIGRSTRACTNLYGDGPCNLMADEHCDLDVAAVITGLETGDGAEGKLKNFGCIKKCELCDDAADPADAYCGVDKVTSARLHAEEILNIVPHALIPSSEGVLMHLCQTLEPAERRQGQLLSFLRVVMAQLPAWIESGEGVIEEAWMPLLRTALGAGGTNETLCSDYSSSGWAAICPYLQPRFLAQLGGSCSILSCALMSMVGQCDRSFSFANDLDTALASSLGIPADESSELGSSSWV